jgi:hypothetical protein
MAVVEAVDRQCRFNDVSTATGQSPGSPTLIPGCAAVVQDVVARARRMFQLPNQQLSMSDAQEPAMTSDANEPTGRASTPCVRNCRLDENHICMGCYRSFQKFSVGAKQLKTKREKSGIGVIFEETNTMTR